MSSIEHPIVPQDGSQEPIQPTDTTQATTEYPTKPVISHSGDLGRERPVVHHDNKLWEDHRDEQIGSVPESPAAWTESEVTPPAPTPERRSGGLLGTTKRKVIALAALLGVGIAGGVVALEATGGKKAPARPQVANSAPVVPGNVQSTAGNKTSTPTNSPSSIPSSVSASETTAPTSPETDANHPSFAPDGRPYHYNHNFPVTGGYDSYKPAIWNYDGTLNKYPPELLQGKDAQGVYDSMITNLLATGSISSLDSTIALANTYLYGEPLEQSQNPAAKYLLDEEDTIFNYRYKTDPSWDPNITWKLLNSSYSADKVVLVTENQTTNGSDTSPIYQRFTLVPAPKSFTDTLDLSQDPLKTPILVIQSSETLEPGDTSLGD